MRITATADTGVRLSTLAAPELVAVQAAARASAA